MMISTIITTACLLLAAQNHSSASCAVWADSLVSIPAMEYHRVQIDSIMPIRRGTRTILYTAGFDAIVTNATDYDVEAIEVVLTGKLGGGIASGSIRKGLQQPSFTRKIMFRGHFTGKGMANTSEHCFLPDPIFSVAPTIETITVVGIYRLAR